MARLPHEASRRIPRLSFTIIVHVAYSDYTTSRRPEEMFPILRAAKRLGRTVQQKLRADRPAKPWRRYMPTILDRFGFDFMESTRDSSPSF